MLETIQITREFRYGDRLLPDPAPTFTKEAVKDFYTAQYSELTNAQIQDLGIQDDKHIYEFKTKVGVKG